jgi:hypothetical protein
MATVAKLNVQIGADLKGLDKSLSKAQKSLQDFGTSIAKIGAGMSKTLTAPLVGFATASVFAFDKQAKAIAQVEQGIKSTGNAAGLTSKELQKMASALQSNSLFGDEEILAKSTAQLLTFTNIAGREFERTQQAALDLATRLGGDLQSASIQLGKALNDPVANLSALSRAGIQFSEDQKAMIDALVETGQLAQAQTVILDELEKQYGGSAKAAAQAGAGGITQLKMSIGDLMEQFGAIIIESITPFINRLKEIVEQLQSTDKQTLKFYVTIGAITAAIGPLLIGLGLLIKSLTTINALLLVTLKNPYVLVGAGVVALTGYYAALFYQAKRTRELLDEPFDSTAPIQEQIQRSIKVVEALDKRVTEMRKNLGAGVTTEEGLEAQQRQLRVAENRLSVERLLLADLIAQSNELKKQVGSTDEIVSNTKDIGKATINLNTSQALYQLRELRDELDDLMRRGPSVSVGVNADTTEFDASLNAIQTKIQLLTNQLSELSQSASIDKAPFQAVEVVTGQFQARTDRIQKSMGLLGNKLNPVKTNFSAIASEAKNLNASVIVLNSITDQFVDSFGAGMANVIVQGEKLQDVLKNIGKLLLSSAIQFGIKLLLGGTSAFGVKDGSTGLIGAIFGKTSGSVGSAASLSSSGFTKARSVVDVRVQDVRITNKDIVLSFNRGQQFLR